MRHAESEANLRREYLKKVNSPETHVGLGMRDADVPLTAAGRAQARTTGAYLNRLGPFDVVYVSPYVRTRQTAEEVLSELRARPRLLIEERVREKEFGVMEGLTKHGLGALHPEEKSRRDTVGKYYYRPPGGESHPDVNLRLQSFLGTLCREHAGRRVLVITHSVVVLLFRRLLERMEEGEVLALDRQDEVKNASLLIYELGSRDGREGVLVRRDWNLAPWEEGQ
jgi:broad specificity phosphatase PhoE